jgi:CDP-4-dehydro-6-deoxyglucose reductase
MSFQITVQPSGHQFSCDEDETVLAAAIRAGVGLPYGCKNGACSSCKGKVLEGSVSHKAHQRRALSEEEEAAGQSLFCCAVPHSDLVLEVREVAGSSDFPIKKMPTRVTTLEKLAPDVIVMTLQLPANETLQYRAGQYVEFMLRDGKRRSYSIANAPESGGPLTLHIRHMPGGLFTDQVFTTMKERDILRFEGPLGTFFVRDDSDKPMILLASGTGFAPIKAIVEHQRAKDSQREMVLYWGGRRPQDLYMDALCRQWQQEIPNFKYVPVVSDALEDEHWTGRRGYVHTAVMEDVPDMSGYQVYACGAPIVVESAKRDFVKDCQLPEDEFYADAFTSQADLLKP